MTDFVINRHVVPVVEVLTRKFPCLIHPLLFAVFTVSIKSQHLTTQYAMSAPSSDFEHEPLATELHPISDATLTVRVIKSFEFRTQKSVILKNLDLRTLTVGVLMDLVREGKCLRDLL